jgi:hypothetical protein
MHIWAGSRGSAFQPRLLGSDDSFSKDRAVRSSYDLEVGEAIGISRNVAANYSF